MLIINQNSFNITYCKKRIETGLKNTVSATVLPFQISFREKPALQRMHCNENHIYVFLFWELRGLSPNIHIYVSASDLYIPRIGPHIPAAE